MSISVSHVETENLPAPASQRPEVPFTVIRSAPFRPRAYTQADQLSLMRYRLAFAGQVVPDIEARSYSDGHFDLSWVGTNGSAGVGRFITSMEGFLSAFEPGINPPAQKFAVSSPDAGSALYMVGRPLNQSTVEQWKLNNSDSILTADAIVTASPLGEFSLDPENGMYIYVSPDRFSHPTRLRKALTLVLQQTGINVPMPAASGLIKAIQFDEYQRLFQTLGIPEANIRSKMN